MKFSIIMPCYNAGSYIHEAIDSIQQQTYTNWELIVVDDGSTDGSFEVVQQLSISDDRIRILPQQHSGKPSVARNNGINHAAGEVLSFLDADDVYEHDRLEALANLFALELSLDCLFHDFDTIDESGRVTGRGLVEEKLAAAEAYGELFEHIDGDSYRAKPLYRFFIVHGCLIHTSSIAIRVDRFEKASLKFRMDLTCAEDLFMWFQLAADGSLGYIRRSLSSYRNVSSSITKDRALLDRDTARFYKILLMFPHQPLDDLQREALRKQIVDNLLSAAYWRSRERNKLGALQLCLEAFVAVPSVKVSKELIKVVLRGNTRVDCEHSSTS